MDIKEFLDQDEIKDLIAAGDLEAVYKRYAPNNYLSDYLLNLGINPIDYFTDSIPDDAFHYCTSLTSVNIPDNITSIGQSAFQNSSLTRIVIPDSVTTIGDCAFYNCTSLTSVTFGENSQLTSIGSLAFSGCTSLTSITIPDSITKIGGWAFADCKSLTSIDVPSSVTEIKVGAFNNCASLTSITIPDSVPEIINELFNGCEKLTSVRIGSGVTRIGVGAFRYCKSLTDINYDGTQAEWRKIKQDRRWRHESPIQVIHCIDGDILLKS